jgi:hypothetical protein
MVNQTGPMGTQRVSPIRSIAGVCLISNRETTMNPSWPAERSQGRCAVDVAIKHGDGSTETVTVALGDALEQGWWQGESVLVGPEHVACQCEFDQTWDP